MTGPLRPGCRLHGPTCRTPWGYDPAHTDQHHPYTLDQLAERTEAPHRHAYPDHAAYLAAWPLWLALRRDAGLNLAERDAADTIRHAPLLKRLGCEGATFGEALKRFGDGHSD